MAGRDDAENLPSRLRRAMRLGKPSFLSGAPQTKGRPEQNLEKKKLVHPQDSHPPEPDQDLSLGPLAHQTCAILAN